MSRDLEEVITYLREVAAQTDKPYGLILAEIRAELGIGEPQ